MPIGPFGRSEPVRAAETGSHALSGPSAPPTAPEHLRHTEEDCGSFRSGLPWIFAVEPTPYLRRR